MAAEEGGLQVVKGIKSHGSLGKMKAELYPWSLATWRAEVTWERATSVGTETRL